MKKTDFKVGDFVYTVDYDCDCVCKMYGIIQEIKDVTAPPIAGTTYKAAVIKVKYFGDGTPCDQEYIYTTPLEYIEPAEVAIKREEEILKTVLNDLKKIKEEFINEA